MTEKHRHSKELSDAFLAYHAHRWDEAAVRFEGVAEKGDVLAMGMAAWSRAFQKPRDWAKVRHWFERAWTKSGDVESSASYASMVFHGWGGKQDRQKAFEICWPHREEAHPVIDGILGRCFHYGYGTDQDVREAEALFRRAIANGNVMAGQFLAWLLIDTGRRANGLAQLVRSYCLFQYCRLVGDSYRLRLW